MLHGQSRDALIGTSQREVGGRGHACIFMVDNSQSFDTAGGQRRIIPRHCGGHFPWKFSKRLTKFSRCDPNNCPYTLSDYKTTFRPSTTGYDYHLPFGREDKEREFLKI